MFAALLLMVAGGLGVLFSLLLLVADTTVDDKIPAFLRDYPAWLSLLLCLVALILGSISFVKQAAVYAYVAVAAALGSLGAFGFVSILALFAVVALVMSRMEGEETRDDGVRLDPSVWPDKAIAASLFIFVVGMVAIFQGATILADRFDPVWLKSLPILAGILDIVVGLFCLVATRELFHQRRAWLGWAAAGVGFLTFGFYVIGPLLALAGMAFLGRATTEGEFD